MSETVWNTPPGPIAGGFSEFSGGGFSQLFSRPAYQHAPWSVAAPHRPTGRPKISPPRRPSSLSCGFGRMGGRDGPRNVLSPSGQEGGRATTTRRFVPLISGES